MKKNLILTFLFIFIVIVANAQNTGEKNQKLLIAAYDGNESEVLKLLLDSADVNARSDEGVTALMYAAEMGHEQIVKILLYNGADPGLKPQSGKTALISAAVNGWFNIVYDLLLYGANINDQDHNGATALILSAGFGNYNMVEYLMLNQANVLLRTNDGTDALLAATFNGYTDIAALLIKNGAQINSSDIRGFTPLSVSLQKKYPALTDTLLKFNCSSELLLKTRRKILAVDYARIMNNRQGAVLLRKAGYKRSLLPYFNSLTLTYHIAGFNLYDYYMGFGVGTYDNKYNFSFEAGMMFRLLRKRVETEISDIRYQLWERRGMLYFGGFKMFAFNTESQKQRHGITIGLKGVYTYGHFEGMNKKPAGIFTAVPCVGYQYLPGDFFFRVMYEYFDTKTYKNSPHWVYLSAGVKIDFHGHKLKKKLKLQ